MFAAVEPRLEIFPGLLRLRCLERVERGVRLLEHERDHPCGKLVVLVLHRNREHVILIHLHAEVLAELLKKVGMELSVELVMLRQVEFADNLVMEFPGIENRGNRIGVLVARGQPEQGTHPRHSAHHGTKAAQRCLRGGRRRHDSSRRIHGLDYPHDRHKHGKRRQQDNGRKQLEVLQVAVDRLQEDFDQADGGLSFHKTLSVIVDINDERRGDHRQERSQEQGEVLEGFVMALGNLDIVTRHDLVFGHAQLQRLGVLAAPDPDLAPGTRNRVDTRCGHVVDRMPRGVVRMTPDIVDGTAHVHEHVLHRELDFGIGSNLGLLHLGNRNPAGSLPRFADTHGLVAIVLHTGTAREVKVFLKGAAFLVGDARPEARENQRDVVANFHERNEDLVTLLEHDVVLEVTLHVHGAVVDMQGILVADDHNIFLVGRRKEPAHLAQEIAQARLRFHQLLAHHTDGAHRVHLELLESRQLHKALVALVALGRKIQDQLARLGKSLPAHHDCAAFLDSDGAIGIHLQRQVVILEHQVQEITWSENVGGVHGNFRKGRLQGRAATRRDTALLRGKSTRRLEQIIVRKNRYAQQGNK